MLNRWHLCPRKKVAQWREKPNGAKVLRSWQWQKALVFLSPYPLLRASPHEVTLVETTLEARFTEDPPKRLIGDRAYDSDLLDERLKNKLSK